MFWSLMKEVFLDTVHMHRKLKRKYVPYVSERVWKGCVYHNIRCYTESWSHWRAKLREWAARPVWAGCYSWAALSLSDSKTLYLCTAITKNENVTYFRSTSTCRTNKWRSPWSAPSPTAGRTFSAPSSPTASSPPRPLTYRWFSTTPCTENRDACLRTTSLSNFPTMYRVVHLVED